MKEKQTIINYLTTSKVRFEQRLNKLKTKSRRFSFYRLAIFLAFLFIFFTFFFAGYNIAAWISFAIFLVVFGSVTGIHNKLDNGIKRNEYWIKIKESHLARINIDWKNIPEVKIKEDSSHPFAEDLGITGKRSLLQLINTSITEEGTNKLKNWMTNTSPDYKTILNRQELIQEMIGLNRFRDKLTLCSQLVSRKNLNDTFLNSWINAPFEIERIKKVLTILFSILPVMLVLIVLNYFGVIPAIWSYPALIYLGVHWFNLKYVTDLFDKTKAIKEDLGRFNVIFSYLEKYPFKQSSRMSELCKTFIANPPGKEIKKLNRLIYAASMQNNLLTAFITNAFFPSNFFIAYKLELLKRDIAKYLPEWLNTWYELEAYNSLSNFAYLNPDYTFPTISNSEGLHFSFKQIAHPLIHYKYNIPNDFELKKRGDITLITGSNMSGKSTFLKTTGTNLVLAFSGSVVNAQEMNTNIFRLFTCINIMDSVTDGISYFLAEVKRLKELLDELRKEESLPILYLIDEIFRGTNNRERLIGSRSFVKEIAKLNGAGLISTHDLELTKLENEIPSLKNFHFREEVSDGKMIFDFKLHSGPCPTTNALKIMAKEGLPVE